MTKPESGDRNRAPDAPESALDDAPARTREELEAVLRAVGDPLNLGTSVDELRRGRFDEVLDKFAQGVPSTPAVSGASSEPVENAPNFDENVFQRLRVIAAASARRRLGPGARHYGRTIVIGSALLVSAGLITQADAVRNRVVPLFGTTARATEDAFGPVREIARAPGQFARSGSEQGRDAEYLRGADAAGAAFLDAAINTVTDNEARLALVAAGVEREMLAADLDGVVGWIAHLDSIPGQFRDGRAHVLREKAYRMLAERWERLNNPGRAQQWREWAAMHAQHAAATERGIRGDGWTPQVADQLRRALDGVRSAEPPADNARFRAGYDETLAEVERIYETLTPVAAPSRQPGRVH